MIHRCGNSYPALLTWSRAVFPALLSRNSCANELKRELREKKKPTPLTAEETDRRYTTICFAPNRIENSFNRPSLLKILTSWKDVISRPSIPTIENKIFGLLYHIISKMYHKFFRKA